MLLYSIPYLSMNESETLSASEAKWMVVYLLAAALASLGAIVYLFSKQIDLFLRITQLFPEVVNGRFSHYHTLNKLRETLPFVDEVDDALDQIKLTLARLNDLRAAMEMELRDQVNAEIADRLAAERTKLLIEWARAEEAEKFLLARDLHDEGGSRMVSIRVDAELISKQYQDDPKLAERAGRISRNADALGKMIKDVIDSLQPPTIEALGLSGSLNGLLSEWRGILDGRCEVNMQIEGEINDIPQVIATVLYRIAQEAITNAAKYAEANRIDVFVKRLQSAGRDWVELFVRDNGLGFDADKAESGTGVKGMRERANVFGGTLTVNSFESGTVVMARFPTSL